MTRESSERLRRCVTAALTLGVSLGLLCLSLLCLRASGSIAVSAGYGRVAHFEAFGGPPDPEEERRTWRTAERFQVASAVLFTSSLGTAAVAIGRLRRTRKDTPPNDYTP